MDISGPVRGLLQRFAAAPVSVTQETDPLCLLVRAVGHPDEELTGVPAFLAPTAPLLAAPGVGRPVHGWLALASALRLFRRVTRMDRWKWEEGLQRQAKPVLDGAKTMLVLRSASAAGIVWHYYLLLLAKTAVKLPVPDVLLQGLWKKAFAGHCSAGHLHPASPPADMPIETFTYEALCALHAAYNAVVMPGGEEFIDPVERVVRWHLENTQPDHATQEPWALAAFAALDDTATFAPQQIHDATNRLQQDADTRIILALLADAALTQEEAAG
jgi:hypothetical protein